MQNNKSDYTIDQIIDAVLYYGDLTPKEAKTALIELMEYVIGDDDYCCATPVGQQCPHGDTTTRNKVRQEQRQRLKEMTELSAKLGTAYPIAPDPLPPLLRSKTNIYRCCVPFQDGYANYSIGDTFELDRVDHRSDHLAVYPKHGHPVSFDAFRFCFEEADV